MPPPLGKVPTKKMPKIDVLGTEDSSPTRGAIRFFRERRIVVRFVDLRKRPIEAADLKAFTERLGAAAFLDPNGAADRGTILARVRTDPGLLKLPLVRLGDDMTAGSADSTWAAWLARRNRGTR